MHILFGAMLRGRMLHPLRGCLVGRSTPAPCDRCRRENPTVDRDGNRGSHHLEQHCTATAVVELRQRGREVREWATETTTR